MSHSIRRRQSVGLMLLLLLLTLITAAFTFYYSYKSAFRLQDDILQQAAYLITPNTQQPSLQLNNHDNQILIQNHLSDPQMRGFIPNLAAYPEGWHSLNEKGEKYRFYLRIIEGEPIAAIFDEAEFRDEIIEHSAWLSVAPLLLLMLLILPLMFWLIQRSLQPIDRLSTKILQRNEDDLTALDGAEVPHELQGFIQAINQLLDKVDQSVRQQQRFIADAAHELRSPMTALSLQAERLIRHPDLQGEAQNLASALEQGIRRNRYLLEQLLSLARAQSGNQQPLAQQAVSVLGVYRQVLETLLPLADEKAIDIGLVSQHDCQLQANAGELYLLIKIIAENAITYLPFGGQVDLSLSETVDELVLEIDDNGVGIPAAERQRVFDPFYRILGSGEQGTGLGLAIAAAIVKRAHGKISLNDSKRFAQGLNVEIRLPKVRSTSGAS